MIIIVLLCAFLSPVLLQQQNKIDEIIHRHWQNLKQSPIYSQFINKDSNSDTTATTSNNHYNKHQYHHTCVHDHIMSHPAVSYRYSAETKQKLHELSSHIPIIEKRSLSQTWGPIRIVADTQWLSSTDALSCQTVGSNVILEPAAVSFSSSETYKCEAVDILTTEKISLLKNHIVPAIIELANKIIQVERSSGNLVLDINYQDVVTKECRNQSGIVLPDFLFGAGVPDCDYYILVSARPIGTNKTAAYASPCSHRLLADNLLSRPLAGSINFNSGINIMNNPKMLSDYFEFSKLVRTAFHELTHALGFTNQLFDNYVNQNGKRYNITISSVYNGGANTFKVITPSVVSYAREFFGCSTLDGVELEDSDPKPDGILIPGSHWEKRIVGNEFMSPVGGPQIFISKLTLSFLDDMGWYKTNKEMADGNRWGYKAGCPFVESACSSATWGRYFCTNNQENSCNGDQTAYAYCDLSIWTGDLPLAYQYFSDATQGGSDSTNNYCPVYQGYSNAYCQDVLSNSGSNLPDAMIFSSTSACFEFTWTSDSTKGAGCYQLTCNTGVLTVKVGQVTVTCTSAGTQKIQIPRNNEKPQDVTFVCPDPSFFCSSDTMLFQIPPTEATTTTPTTTTTTTTTTPSEAHPGAKFCWLFILIALFFCV